MVKVRDQRELTLSQKIETLKNVVQLPMAMLCVSKRKCFVYLSEKKELKLTRAWTRFIIGSCAGRWLRVCAAGWGKWLMASVVRFVRTNRISFPQFRLLQRLPESFCPVLYSCNGHFSQILTRGFLSSKGFRVEHTRLVLTSSFSCHTRADHLFKVQAHF